MRKIKLFMAGLACFLFFAFQTDAILAVTELQAPDKVARGDAFVARAITDEPGQRLTFHWRGKPYTVEAMPMADGRRQAEILLPVPLDEKASNLRLGVGKDEKTPPAAQAGITVFERQRPVQKLKVDRKYVDTPPEVKARIAADREKVKAALQDKIDQKAWALPLENPVPGNVSSLFGMKRVFNGQLKSVHRGLDLRGATGTPVKACADGRVALVDNLYFSGNTVYVNHGDGVFTAYLHLSDTRVKPGDVVKRGDVIGEVGATGRVTGPHLHLSLIVQGQSVDPQPLLKVNPDAKKQTGKK